MNLNTELAIMNEKYTFAHSKKWALEFLEKVNPELGSKIKSVKDYYFNNIGFVCKINKKAVMCSEDKLIERLENLQRYIPEPTPVAPVKKPMKRINPNLYMIDEYIDHILRQTVSAPFVFASLDKTDIAELKLFCEKNFEEIITYPEEFKTETIRELKNFYKEVLKKIKNFEAPVSKKPTPAGPILTPHQQTRDVQFERNAIDGLKSEHPATIVGKHIAFVFDPKYKSLIQYVSTEEGFAFSGTTLKNVHLEKCIRKTADLRDVIKNKKNIPGLISSLKTKETTPGCRFSKNFIILGGGK